MVTDPGSARKRIRDYAAERERRNLRARAMGFTSLDALAKARRRGEFPTAREIRTDPAKRFEAERLAVQRIQQRVNQERDSRPFRYDRSRENAKKRDDESAEWSRKFSRQKGTKFSRSWSAQRKEEYYQAFVRQYRLPNDERDFRPTYDYMRKYWSDVPRDLDTNPYSRQ